MNSTALRNSDATLPVSKWDVRIRDNKRRRNAEIRRHLLTDRKSTRLNSSHITIS